jgi:hypothetical protein
MLVSDKLKIFCNTTGESVWGSNDAGTRTGVERLGNSSLKNAVDMFSSILVVHGKICYHREMKLAG